MWVYWLHFACVVHQPCLALSHLWVCDCVRLTFLQASAIGIEILTYLSLASTLVAVDIYSGGLLFGYLGRSLG